jgi:hypothetical protein
MLKYSEMLKYAKLRCMKNKSRKLEKLNIAKAPPY